MTTIQSEHFKKLLEQDQKLLDAIKAHLPELERLLSVMPCLYEDGIYRFYHQSFKVYSLQDYTLKAAELFKSIGREVDKSLCKWFEEIVTNGTGTKFEMEHNENWKQHTRPIVEAFLHAKYFVEMMVKYGREAKAPTNFFPSGWAAILTLYGQR